ncbi:MAG TPA: insulinase family protein [Firmicutes bacterium]|nr:insulinase family protein [Bacillota bacterium]
MKRTSPIQRLPLLLSLILGVIVVTAAPVLAVRPDSPLIPYTKVVLDNGLTVVVKEVHSAPIVAVDIWVATGAKNEDPKDSGISHFFEHMLFKGTERRKVGEIAKAIQSVGGYLNAMTSLDTTHYFVVVPSEYIDLALDVEADAIMNSTFDPAEIERERNVILEERRLVEDNPQSKLGWMVYQAVFAGTPYANDVLGTPETLANISRETFLRYHEKYYVPNNMVVVVVGDVDTWQVIQQVKKLFSGFKPREVPPLPAFQVPGLKEIKRVEAEKQVDQTYLYFGFPGPSKTAKDSAALTVLGAILGGGRSSRLYQDLRENKKLVNTVAAGHQAYQDIGMFVVYAQTKDTGVSTLEEEVRSAIRRIRNEGVTEEELSRAKAMARSSFAFASESNAAIASILGEFEVSGSAEDATEYEARIQEVTKEDVLRVAREYLNPDGYVLAVVRPQGVK